MSTLFPDLPRSTMHTRRGERVMHYVEPSRMVSLRWDAGAEFLSPTSLDFKTKTLEAQTLGAQAAMPAEPMHPDYIVDTLRALWRQLGRELHRAARVVDHAEPCGVEVGTDWQRNHVVYRSRLKTWPAVRGVTVAGGWEDEHGTPTTSTGKAS